MYSKIRKWSLSSGSERRLNILAENFSPVGPESGFRQNKKWKVSFALKAPDGALPFLGWCCQVWAQRQVGSRQVTSADYCALNVCSIKKWDSAKKKTKKTQKKCKVVSESGLWSQRRDVCCDEEETRAATTTRAQRPRHVFLLRRLIISFNISRGNKRRIYFISSGCNWMDTREMYLFSKTTDLNRQNNEVKC